MKASSPQRFSLWIHTADGKRRLMIQPFGQDVWLLPNGNYLLSNIRGAQEVTPAKARAFLSELGNPFGKINQDKDGNTPLRLAEVRGHTEVAELLRQHGGKD